MNIETKCLDNECKQYTLVNDNQMRVTLLTIGATITEIIVPDKNGKLENVVLSYEKHEDYVLNKYYFGSIIGPVAGRIANSAFTIDHETYSFQANEGEHLLHSGTFGLHQVVWKGKPFQKDNSVGVTFTYTLDDKSFPGIVDIHVTYTLTNEQTLRIHYYATSSDNIFLTLTNHTYFNLSGNAKNTIHNHYVKMNSDYFLQLDQQLIPTGNKIDVTNSTFDFRHMRKLKDGFIVTDEQHKIASGGYDHYFLFNKKNSGTVIVQEKTSGRQLIIQTDQPGLTMYSASTLNNDVRISGGVAKKYAGVCFETHAPPASLIHPHLPSIYLNKDKVYKKETTFSFQPIE